MRAPDRIDHAILNALQNNARLANKELAAQVGLAPSSCLERVRRLEAARIVRGYHADVDPKRVGVRMQAMIMVRLNKHSRGGCGDVPQRHARPARSARRVPGGRRARLPDPRRRARPGVLRAFALDHVTSRDEVVHVETSLIFEHCRSHVLPGFPAP